MNELESLLVLNAIPGVGNNRIEQLIADVGSAQQVFCLSREQLKARPYLTADVADRIARFDAKLFLKEELSRIKDANVVVLSRFDRNYPALLKEIPDAPFILYTQGDLNVLAQPCLAIVGSRQASIYGLNMAEKFATELTELGISIISGMARGVDTAAHRSTIRMNGKTAGVLGCGLSVIYPPENKELLQSMKQKALLISEFPMTAQPLTFHFPRRNRIISGLSLGVIVIEASLKSGALITSRFALEQGREVFALPGKIDHPNTAGVHRLIKQGAKLVTCVEDIVEDLQHPLKSFLKKEAPVQAVSTLSRKNLNDFDRKVIELVSRQPVHVDEMASRLQMGTSILMNSLLNLEINRHIKQLPGKFFVAADN